MSTMFKLLIMFLSCLLLVIAVVSSQGVNQFPNGQTFDFVFELSSPGHRPGQLSRCDARTSPPATARHDAIQRSRHVENFLKFYSCFQIVTSTMFTYLVLFVCLMVIVISLVNSQAVNPPLGPPPAYGEPTFPYWFLYKLWDRK
ncbi:hypothetical protein Btru_027482 [Bulinus truncatus]|nr:hypothetical protein Btru_027482 [Bulinus truncatus]